MVWELIKSLIFGIVEGITEWLPISSTGHLILLDEFLKLDATDNFKEMFDVVIQLGAILAVVVIYWKKLWPFGKQDNPHPMAQTGFGACLKKDILQMWCKVIVATVPAAVIGLLLDDWSQAHLYNAWTVAIMLILFGIAFIWIENVFFQLPDLTARTSAVAGRIHNDGIVFSAAANLPCHKLFAVIDDPANGLFCQSGQCGIFPCPLYHALGRVHVAHRSTGGGTCQRCTAGIGEQVQDRDRSAGVALTFDLC